MTFRKKQENVDEQILDMDKLNSLINTAEKEMLRLKKQYETVVESRNFTGIMLIDRNDELCILYEKANIQEEVRLLPLPRLDRRPVAGPSTSIITLRQYYRRRGTYTAQSAHCSSQAPVRISPSHPRHSEPQIAASLCPPRALTSPGRCLLASEYLCADPLPVPCLAAI